MAERYIWISRWEEFQHYEPRRDRGPAWIKTHTAQLHDDRYLSLTSVQRSVLQDLRMLFANTRGKLPKDTRKLSGLLHERVTEPTLKALNHAGFIEFVSRPTLERRLEELYASRARPRGREKLEVEEEKDTKAVNGSSSEEASAFKIPPKARLEAVQ